MTVFGSGYRSLEVARTPAWRRIWALAVTVFRAPFGRRLGLLAYLAAFLPGLINIVILLVTSGLIVIGEAAAPGGGGGGAGRLFDPTAAQTYLRLATEQFTVFGFALTAWITCRSIARDRTAGGLELLWTRGITPSGYFLAHWIGSFALLALPTLGCQLLLYLVAYTTSSDEEFLAQSIEAFGRAFAGTAALVGFLTLLPLLLSAIVARAQLASILWIGGVLGLGVVVEIASLILRGVPAVKLISPWLAMQQLANEIGGVSDEGLLVGSLASLCGFCLLLGPMALRRLRPTEALS